MDKIVPKNKDNSSLSKLGNKLRSQGSTFQQHIAEAKQQSAQVEASDQERAMTMPNRIALMLDCSSSMQGENLDRLKQAVESFALRCNFADTSVAIRTFPERFNLELTTIQSRVAGFVHTLQAGGGGTPMHRCVMDVIETIPLTRGVIVSDGEATDWRGQGRVFEDLDYANSVSPDQILQAYKSQAIPIDCVHIGGSTQGEKLLQHIAELTGGLYLKFTDVSAFSTAFGYLAPAYRALLCDGRADANLLGAREVIK